MANATTPPSSSVVAAGTCTPLPGKPCLPSKSGTSAGVGHHPVLSASLPGSSSKPPPTSVPILLPITRTPSGNPVAHSGWPVTSGLHATPKSSLGKPSQSFFIFPQPVTTMNSHPTRSLVSASLDTAAWPLIPNSHVSKSHSSYPQMPSNASYTPYKPSPATTTHSTATSISCSEMPGSIQSVFSTVTSTVTDAPRPTFPAPVSIAETTGGQPTVSAPSITSTGMTTLTGGAVSNPAQQASSSSAGRSFFGNHPVVIGVLLASGIAISCVVILALYCLRRRRRQTRSHGRRLQDISPPILPPISQIPFKLSGPYGGSSNQIATMQTYINVPLNRSGDSLPVVAHPKIDIPLPQPARQLRTSRSAHRVPVRYSGLGAPRDSSGTVGRQYTGPLGDYHPVQVVQTHPSPNAPPPPPLPERSPLRLLATKSSLNTSQENPNRSSGASSLSIYPPSSSTYEAMVTSENNPDVDYGRKKVGTYIQTPGLSTIDSSRASLPWPVQDSHVENPSSGTGPAQTSVLDEVCRTVPLTQVPRTALGGYKFG